MKPIYVSGYDSWPYDYCVWALQFLALSEKDLSRYLPDVYPGFVAEIGIGLTNIVGPLDGLLQLCQSFLSPGTTYSEWAEDNCPNTELAESNFVLLLDKLQYLEISTLAQETAIRDLLGRKQTNGFLDGLSYCREIARQNLTLLGWEPESTILVFAASELLDEAAGQSRSR